MEWHHWPIEDVGVPSLFFESMWEANSARARSLLQTNANVLVHCKGGRGRAGMVAARLLAEVGVPPEEAIRTVRAAREGAIETSQQDNWVKAGRTSELLKPARATGAIRDRATANTASFGLRVNSSVVPTASPTARPSSAPTDLVGGGPFGLTPGQWTDDTAMALADSLLAKPSFDPVDLMDRFVAWHETGEYSCVGKCFDIGTPSSHATS